MAARRLSTSDKIKTTCEELEMTKMMCFKYSWNKEIICQFYSTLCFNADAQTLLWMTDGQRCAITIREFARMLGLEHQLTMLPDAWIHTYNVLKLDAMQFMYAPGVVARPPKIQNFLLELNTLLYLLRATLTPRIGDVISCPQYERNLIQFYVCLPCPGLQAAEHGQKSQEVEPKVCQERPAPACCCQRSRL
jgi:hypothetical protein